MGGFSSFQKRFGDATVANETLIAVKAGNQPDIYKMAKMFAPDMELVPVTKTWYKKFGFSDWEAVFDGVYFGIFTLSHNSVVVGKSNNKYRRSFCNIKHNDAIKFSSFIGYHGDDILPMHSNSYEYIGYGTSCEILSPWGEECEHGFSLSFIGFKLEDLPNFSLRVNNSSTKSIKVEIGGVAQIIPATGQILENHVLGTEIKITPMDGGSISVGDRVYNDANPYSSTLFGNTIIEALDPILVGFSNPLAQIYFDIFSSGRLIYTSQADETSFEVLVGKNSVLEIRTTPEESNQFLITYDGETHYNDITPFTMVINTPKSFELAKWPE